MVQAYENERLFPALKVQGGRRQITLTGNLEELFLVNLAAGARPLRESLQWYAQRRGYEIILFLDASGQLTFANQAMQERYQQIVREVTRAPAESSGGQVNVFSPRRKSAGARETSREPPAEDAAGTASEKAADRAQQQVAGAAPGLLQTSLDHIARLMRSPTKSLVVFEHPEKLWVQQPDTPTLQKLESVLKWGTTPPGHRDSCSILLVNPNRLEEFNRVADHCGQRSHFSQEVCLGLPSRLELERFTQRLLYRHGLRGSPRRLAATAQARELTLYQFCELIVEHLAVAKDKSTLEGLFAEGEQGQTLEELQEELQRLVGLETIKCQVEDVIRIAADEASRRRAGQDVSPLSYHMFFLGNPGTGKTIVARLLGRLFWALGLRARQVFVEISAQDIISPYNEGETLDRMAQAIQRALGGVLFIDEVYLIAENQWGRKALEVLMKAMEDQRDNLTVIMAGYEEKLPELFKVNPGFQSRVPYTLHFPDYATEEVLAIFDLHCEQAKLTTSDKAREKLKRYVLSCERRGGIGNGRGARNLFEKVRAALARSGGMRSQILPAHVPDPICFDEPNARRVLEQLEQDFIGLQRVKDSLRRLFIRQKGLERKGQILRGFNHFLFLGNPGTGKTTVARIIGELFYRMGLISQPNRLIEIDPIHDLTSPYQSEYASKVRDCFDRALGGVLFIDEAYQLTRPDQSQGPLVLDQIVKLMTEPRYRDLVVIMAGYPDEMREMLQSNPGLERRLAHRLVFEDFSAAELCEIFERCVARDGLRIAPRDQTAFGRQLRAILEKKRQKRGFGNAGAVEEFFETSVRVNQEMRLDEHPEADPHELQLADLFEKQQVTESVSAILDELDSRFVGMQPLKQSVRQLAKMIEFDQRRRQLQPEAGAAPTTPLLNMRLVGNPGTGKTTIARYLARVLNALGLLQNSRVHECRGLDLTASYEGQTKDRVNKLFEDCAGGLIIIDEVYSLYDPQAGQISSFAQQAINTLVGQITDPRSAGTVVILAGYKDRMDAFLNANPGLKSRFPYEIEFPDYTPEECLQILEQKLQEQGFRWPEQHPAFHASLRDYFRRAAADRNFGNARSVGTVFECLKGSVAERVLSMSDPRPEDYSLITVDDLRSLDS